MKSRITVAFQEEGKNQTEYTVEADGLFMYRDHMSSADSLRSFITDFRQSKQDFNECYGAYRMSIVYEGGSVFFSDNSGMMRYYINTREQSVYCSLEEAEKDRQKRIPNYHAIAQFLCYGCVYDQQTVLQSVILSDPNVYYVISDGQMEERTKNLKAIADYQNEKKTLKEIIAQAVAHCDGVIGCTITGGVDSRAVLANLLDLGIKPPLAITGHESQPDVKIAQEIAETLGLNISVISDAIEEDDWLDQSIKEADGQEGICSIYRLDKFAKYLQKNRIDLQFGGMNGEMYKNSFLNQDFPIYCGKPRWDRFYQYKVGTFNYDQSLWGGKIRNEIDRLPSFLKPWLSSHQGTNKAEAYLNAGYELMQARCNLVINMFQRHVTYYNPLMERRMAAYAYGNNPYRLEMQAFQRREVTEKCGKIKDIPTDRGLTCNYGKRGREFLKSYLFLVKIALQRLLFRNRIDIRIDPCFETGLHSEAYYQAIENVKRLEILGADIRPEDIPTGLADRLFTIGLLFASKQ